jgi:WD40 repeat protein
VATLGHAPPIGPGGASRVAFSRDGATLLSLDARVYACDLTTGSRQARPPFPPTDLKLLLSCMAVSPDGRTAATGGFPLPHGGVRLWDVASRKLLRVLGGQPDRVTALVFEADGRRLAGWNGRSVQFWDVTSGQLLETRPLQGLIVLPRRSGS